MAKKIRCIQIGMGPIGRQTTRYLVERRHLELVGGVDVDPAKLGQDLGTLAGIDALGVEVKDSLDAFTGKEVDVAVVTTSSSLENASPLFHLLLTSGIHVVSSCEELAYPWETQPILSKELDRTAREQGVAILGTGVNPGFMMDYLPAAFTAVCSRVEHIRVERIQDASLRRLPFQNKIGAGLSAEEFQERVEKGILRHVGLTESMHLIASQMGWHLDRTEDLLEPVIATQEVRTSARRIEKGKALGVRQTGRGFIASKPVLELEFRATIGESETFDRILISGQPNLDVKTLGVNGDVATCAIAVNAIPVVVKSAPGLHTMADIPPISCVG